MIQAVYAGRGVICTAINKEKSFRALLDVIELRKGEDSYGD
jgi:hypothetical protein